MGVVLAGSLGLHRDGKRAALHAPPAHTRAWPLFCESQPVQVAASHLVRAEATVSCRGRGGSAELRRRIILYFAGIKTNPHIAAPYRIVCTQLLQHAHAVHTRTLYVACEAQRVRSTQKTACTSEVYSAH